MTDMMFLSKTINFINELEDIMGFLHGITPETLTQSFSFFKEDVMLTFQSSLEIDAVKTSKIVKKTEKFANDYYAVKAYYFAHELYQIALQQRQKKVCEQLVKIQVQIQNSITFSLNHQDEIKNPFPRQLFFSQKFHNPHFSLKSQRRGVSGELLEDIAQQLRQHEISPDYLRVNIYFAPFRNELCPFVYNNRTWVVFSKSNQEASRIVPLLPTQDMLNRIIHMDIDNDPSVIRDESNERNITLSLKK